MVKNLPGNAGDAGQAGSVLGLEGPLEKEMATHSSILAWKFCGLRSLGGYQPRGRKESSTTELTHGRIGRDIPHTYIQLLSWGNLGCCSKTSIPCLPPPRQEYPSVSLMGLQSHDMIYPMKCGQTEQGAWSESGLSGGLCFLCSLAPLPREDTARRWHL